MSIVDRSARKPYCDSGYIRFASFWRRISKTRAHNLPTMLSGNGNDIGVYRVLWYSSFLSAITNDFVQWEEYGEYISPKEDSR